MEYFLVTKYFCSSTLQLIWSFRPHCYYKTVVNDSFFRVCQTWHENFYVQANRTRNVAQTRIKLTVTCLRAWLLHASYLTRYCYYSLPEFIYMHYISFRVWKHFVLMLKVCDVLDTSQSNSQGRRSVPWLNSCLVFGKFHLDWSQKK